MKFLPLFINCLYLGEKLYFIYSVYSPFSDRVGYYKFAHTHIIFWMTFGNALTIIIIIIIIIIFV